MHHLTREEIKLLLSDSRLTARQRLLFKVGFWHGLRVTELTQLKREDIADGYVHCRRLKGSMRTYQRFQVHADSLLDEARELRALFSELAPGERLFPWSRQWVWQLMQQIGTRTGLPAKKMHPHVLKHSIAMQSIKTAGIENVRQHLGHQSLASTGYYLKVTDDEASDAIAAAMC